MCDAAGAPLCCGLRRTIVADVPRIKGNIMPVAIDKGEEAIFMSAFGKQSVCDSRELSRQVWKRVWVVLKYVLQTAR